MNCSFVAEKHASHFGRLRKRVSRVFVALWLTAAVLMVPKGLCTGWHEVGELVGFLMLIVAALGRVWSLAYVGGRKNRELCQGGPYSMTRNPLYFFSFLGVVGFGLALQHVLLGFIAAASFLVYYTGVIRGEERRLRDLFGERFDAYQALVPRFWPKLGMPVHENVLQLNVKVFTRGLREVFWFLFAIIFAEMLEWLHAHGFFATGTSPF